MKQWLLFLVAAVFAVACKSSQVSVQAVRSGSDIAAQTNSYTVALMRLSITISEKGLEAGLKPYCAGVWISYDKILTAAHCTRSVKDVDGVFLADLMVSYSKKAAEENEVDAAELLKRDEKADLALLRARKPPQKHGFAKIRQGEIQQGEPCFIVGHPGGYAWTYTAGVISGFRTIDDNSMIVTTAAVWFGNSGGGMFDDLGNLEGIASLLDGRSLKYAFFVHRDAIQKFLK